MSESFNNPQIETTVSEKLNTFYITFIQELVQELMPAYIQQQEKAIEEEKQRIIQLELDLEVIKEILKPLQTEKHDKKYFADQVSTDQISTKIEEEKCPSVVYYDENGDRCVKNIDTHHTDLSQSHRQNWARTNLPAGTCYVVVDKLEIANQYPLKGSEKILKDKSHKKRKVYETPAIKNPVTTYFDPSVIKEG
jgi:hypothetical protein